MTRAPATILAWHFTADTLRNGDAIPPIGKTLKMEGRIAPMERGYHASKRALDALRYASGSHIHRVELSGTVVPHSGDKHAASERTLLWSLDCETSERVLREFARWCALSVAHLWNMPAIVREYLETGDETKRYAAGTAAGDAADAGNTAPYSTVTNPTVTATHAAATAACTAADPASNIAKHGGAVRAAQNKKLESTHLRRRRSHAMMTPTAFRAYLKTTVPPLVVLRLNPPLVACGSRGVTLIHPQPGDVPMDLHSTRTHLIIRMDSEDRHTAPGCVLMATTSAEMAASKAEGFRFWNYDVAIVALDDADADPRWKGKHATPREFFGAEYDNAGVPRSWIVRNAVR